MLAIELWEVKSVVRFVFLIPQRRCFHKSALCIDDLKLFKSMKKTHKLARFRPCYAITAYNLLNNKNT